MKKINKILSFLLLITTVFSSFITVNAQTTVDNLYQDDNYKFWVATWKRDGSARVATQETMIRRTSDNSPVYCIQAPIQFNSGSQVNGIIDRNTMISMSGLNGEQIDRIRLIAYYGYGYEGHEDVNWYYATQLLIWSVTDPGYTYAIADGDHSLTPSNRYDTYYNEINSLVDNHRVQPSFNGEKIEMKAGETITLNDTHRVLSKYYESYEDDHIKATVNDNNTLTVLAKTGYEGNIILFTKENINPPMLYEGANQLCMSDGDPDMNATYLTIYATTEVDVTKVYGSTDNGVYRPEKDAEFEVYKDEELFTTIKTDKNGKFILDLGYGTYRIHQIKGKDKHDFIKDYTFVIDGSTDKEVIYFKNELIVGDLDFTKTDISTGEALPNTTIEVYNAETNELIGTYVTDFEGKVSIKKLEAGKYYILEKNAPEGYELNPEKMYFEVTKNGEVVKVNMKDHKIKKVSSYNIPDTAVQSLSDVATSLIIIILLAGAYVVVSKGKDKNNKQ